MLLLLFLLLFVVGVIIIIITLFNRCQTNSSYCLEVSALLCLEPEDHGFLFERQNTLAVNLSSKKVGPLSALFTVLSSEPRTVSATDHIFQKPLLNQFACVKTSSEFKPLLLSNGTLSAFEESSN